MAGLPAPPACPVHGGPCSPGVSPASGKGERGRGDPLQRPRAANVGAGVIGAGSLMQLITGAETATAESSPWSREARGPGATSSPSEWGWGHSLPKHRHFSLPSRHILNPIGSIGVTVRGNCGSLPGWRLRRCRRG